MEIQANPKVSVIMSVYNEPIEWIDQSIDSILNQTFVDFEFIIVNDNPRRDDNRIYLNQKSKKDSRIKIIENEENLGLAASLNIGIAHAKGNYIARMDADDLSLPSRFAKQVKLLDKNINIGVCGTFARFIYANNKKGRKLNLNVSDRDLKNAIWFLCPFVHPSVMMRRDVLKNNLYDEQCRIGQDWELWLRLQYVSGFANIPEILLLYRLHDNQSTEKAGARKTYESRRYSASKKIELLGLNSGIVPIYKKWLCNEYLSSEELDYLFLNLSKEPSLRDSYKYLIGTYIKEKLKKDKKGIILNPLYKNNRPAYLLSLLEEGCRWLKTYF